MAFHGFLPGMNGIKKFRGYYYQPLQVTLKGEETQYIEQNDASTAPRPQRRPNIDWEARYHNRQSGRILKVNARGNTPDNSQSNDYDKTFIIDSPAFQYKIVADVETKSLTKELAARLWVGDGVTFMVKKPAQQWGALIAKDIRLDDDCVEWARDARFKVRLSGKILWRMGYLPGKHTFTIECKAFADRKLVAGEQTGAISEATAELLKAGSPVWFYAEPPEPPYWQLRANSVSLEDDATRDQVWQARFETRHFGVVDHFIMSGEGRVYMLAASTFKNTAITAKQEPGVIDDYVAGLLENGTCVSFMLRPTVGKEMRLLARDVRLVGFGTRSMDDNESGNGDDDMDDEH